MTTISVTIQTAHITYAGDPALAEAIQRIEGALANMATEAEIRSLFGEINSATDEIAADIEALLNRPEVPESVKTDAQAIVTRLQGIASAFDPVPPASETPGSEPLPETPAETPAEAPTSEGAAPA